MRISVDKDDPGYITNPAKWLVLFNGQLARDCITADDVKSYIIRYKRKDGKLVKGELERIDGQVEIKSL